MNILDWLPGLEVAQTTHRRGRARTTRRTFRLTASPRRDRRQTGPGLLWHLTAAVTKRLGGRPKCPGCGRVIEQDGDVLCARCGLPLYPLLHPNTRGAWQLRTCPKCRRELRPDDKFCPACQVRSRVKRQAARTERQVRTQRKVAMQVDRDRTVETYLRDQGITPATVLGKRAARKPVKVDAYTKDDGTAVESHTRQRPGEGSESA